MSEEKINHKRLVNRIEETNFTFYLDSYSVDNKDLFDQNETQIELTDEEIEFIDKVNKEFSDLEDAYNHAQLILRTKFYEAKRQEDRIRAFIKERADVYRSDLVHKIESGELSIEQ